MIDFPLSVLPGEFYRRVFCVEGDVRVGGSGNKKGPVGASCTIAGHADHIRSVDGAPITRISMLIASILFPKVAQKISEQIDRVKQNRAEGIISPQASIP